jgi:hypothetical protein
MVSAPSLQKRTFLQITGVPLPMRRRRHLLIPSNSMELKQRGPYASDNVGRPNGKTPAPRRQPGAIMARVPLLTGLAHGNAHHPLQPQGSWPPVHRPAPQFQCPGHLRRDQRPGLSGNSGFEVIALETTSNIPPYTTRYVTNQRDDLHLPAGTRA